MIDRDEISSQLSRSIYDKQIDRLRQLCSEHPWLVSDHMYDEDETTIHKSSWMIYAVKESSDYRVIQTMLDLGFNINAVGLPEVSTVVVSAISACDLKMLEFLLSKGADPNLGRPIIAALNCEKKDLQLPMIKLLLEHGLNINNVFDLYGEKDALFTALDWASRRPDMVAFLRSHGAKTEEDLAAEAGKTALVPATRSYEEEVIAYFNENFGPVHPQAQTEIVPTGEPIAIHAVEPGKGRKLLTLFTTGLSAIPMTVPAGQEKFALAELYIQLPGDWRFSQLNTADRVWPAFWLRKIARYPREQGTWLGGLLTIIANDDPPRPLAPDLPFTSVMLFADRSFVRGDGQTVQLYRLVPLYREERDLELRGGIPALLQAFDKAGTPFVVDPKRKNVGLK